MKILDLKMENFLTVGEASLALADRGLILIQGENLDDSSTISNGAGKSSIVDGLSWLFFGTTARNVTGDSVINHTAKKNCAVSALIEDEGSYYRIARHRKHTTNKNALLVDKVDATGAVVASMTKGTDKETQEVVNTILGCSIDVFNASIYAGQEKMPDLPAMTDKHLKVLIEEAAGVEVLEEAHNIAKTRLNIEKAKLADVSNKAENISYQLNSTKSLLENEEKKQKEFDDTKQARVKAKLAEVLVEKRAIEAAEAEKAKINKSALLDRRKKLVEQIDSAKTVNAEIEAKRELYQKSANLEYRKQTDYDAKANAARRQAQEIKSLEKLVGTSCKECGKTICSHDLADASAAKRTQVENYVREAKAIQTELNQVKLDTQNLKADWDKALLGMVNVSELSNKIAQIDNILRSLDGIDTKISIHANAKETLNKAANELYRQENPFSESIKNFKEKIIKLEADSAANEIELLEASESVELHTAAVGVYGAGGVRAHILDTVTPFLNDRTRDYLGALSDGNIHATWTTLTETAKKELKEKFSIAVTNDTGANSFAGLSGGEKRKVRLATALALQDLVASRATKPIQLFVGDEIDDALDSAGIERLMTVLERKARERGTVLVISHNELKDYCDQVIVVHKKGGQSTISGDTHK